MDRGHAIITVATMLHSDWIGQCPKHDLTPRCTLTLSFISICLLYQQQFDPWGLWVGLNFPTGTVWVGLWHNVSHNWVSIHVWLTSACVCVCVWPHLSLPPSFPLPMLLQMWSYSNDLCLLLVINQCSHKCEKHMAKKSIISCTSQVREGVKFLSNKLQRSVCITSSTHTHTPIVLLIPAIIVRQRTLRKRD